MYVLLVYKVVTPNIYQGLQIVLFSICVPIGSEPEFSHRALIKVPCCKHTDEYKSLIASCGFVNLLSFWTFHHNKITWLGRMKFLM